MCLTFLKKLTPLRVILLCGIGLLIISLILTVILFFNEELKFTPNDFAAFGLAFIGFVMAWPQFERDFRDKKI
jgi:hypothetical protein